MLDILQVCFDTKYFILYNYRKVIIMFNSKASIKFMMAKIFFTLANFSYKTLSDVTPSVYHGTKTLEINYIRNGYGRVIVEDKEYGTVLQIQGDQRQPIAEFLVSQKIECIVFVIYAVP